MHIADIAGVTTWTNDASIGVDIDEKCNIQFNSGPFFLLQDNEIDMGSIDRCFFQKISCVYQLFAAIALSYEWFSTCTVRLL